MTREEFIEIRSKFKTDIDCMKSIGIGKNKYYALKRELGLVTDVDRSKIDENKFLELYNEGKNDIEIGKILGVSNKRICNLRNKLNLSNNTEKHLEFTNDQLQIFLGGMLGDGSLSIASDSKNYYYSFAHSTKQRNYCIWKYEQLKNLCHPYHEYVQHDKRTNKDYCRIDVRTYYNVIFTDYYNKFYKIVDNKKVKYINIDILNLLNPLGIAIWFMDDGYKEDNGYCISTNCFSEDDIDIIINFFKSKYDIDCSMHANRVLYIKANSRNKFTKLIKPYIHSDLEYKLHHCPE